MVIPITTGADHFTVQGPTHAVFNPLPPEANNDFDVTIFGSSLDSSDRIRFIGGTASCGGAAADPDATDQSSQSGSGSATQREWIDITISSAGFWKLCYCVAATSTSSCSGDADFDIGFAFSVNSDPS